MLTVAEFKAHYSPDLTDAAIERLIDAAYQQIDAECGSVASGEVTVSVDRRYSVYLPYRAASVPEGYELMRNRNALCRVDGGMMFGDVTYTVVDTTELREMAAIDLVKLACDYRGQAMVSAGAVSETMPEYHRERRAVLWTLRQAVFG